MVAFIVTQIIPISTLSVFAEELNTYTQNFDDGNVGGWKPAKGTPKEPLSVVGGNLVFKNNGDNII
ncbi:hypothetical protein GNF72_15385, partial [Clostridium perfringens]|uniref:hypothetical protein n=1 Tax=Clostridium perfringens TaxID=1502 RepID=UPI002AC71BFA